MKGSDSPLAWLRWIPSGAPGKYRLSRLLVHRFVKGTDIHVRDRYGCAMTLPNAREPVGFSLLVDGAYEPAAVDFVLSRLAPGDTFVDVGANIGCFTLPAARRVGERGNVVAVEASPRIHNYLARNIRDNALANVHAMQCAALESDGTTQFHDAPEDHFGMGSVAPQFGTPPITVAAWRLDTIMKRLGIRKVAVMKVDVEGYECSVFRGAADLLTGSDPPLVVFEFCDWAEKRTHLGLGASQRVLRDMGYSIWKFDDYVRGRARLETPLEHGFDTLVASRA